MILSSQNSFQTLYGEIFNIDIFLEQLSLSLWLNTYICCRCEGTLVACQYAGAGCEFRGPAKRMKDHQTECTFKKEG